MQPSSSHGTSVLTPEDAYMLWRTGEITEPPPEHMAYCLRRKAEAALTPARGVVVPFRRPN